MDFPRAGSAGHDSLVGLHVVDVCWTEGSAKSRDAMVAMVVRRRGRLMAKTFRNDNMLGRRRTEECLLHGGVSGRYEEGRLGAACARKCCGKKHGTVRETILSARRLPATWAAIASSSRSWDSGMKMRWLDAILIVAGRRGNGPCRRRLPHLAPCVSTHELRVRISSSCTTQTMVDRAKGHPTL